MGCVLNALRNIPKISTEKGVGEHDSPAKFLVLEKMLKHLGLDEASQNWGQSNNRPTLTDRNSLQCQRSPSGIRTKSQSVSY